MQSWPEKVRVALLATAHNVDFNYWNYKEDGRDGAGVVSGADAVWFARNHQWVWDQGQAVDHGIAGNYISEYSEGSRFYYSVHIPNPMPAGKHLRIVLTWDSSPCENEAVNDLSDLDLSFNNGAQLLRSWSIDDNVEMLDISRYAVLPGRTHTVYVDVRTVRIPSCAVSNISYYAIGWTWVKDHAD
jgi:hypothetical protein